MAHLQYAVRFSILLARRGRAAKPEASAVIEVRGAARQSLRWAMPNADGAATRASRRCCARGQNARSIESLSWTDAAFRYRRLTSRPSTKPVAAATPIDTHGLSWT